MDTESATSIFLPLQSNAAWFGDPDLKEQLERRIKTHLALYDYVVFEDGRYSITVGTNQLGMAMRASANATTVDRRTIRYFEPGQSFGIYFGDTPAAMSPVMSGICEWASDVDFFPIVHAAGLEDATCIRWTNLSITKDAEREIDTQVRDELRSMKLDDALPKNRFLRENVLKSLYRDSVIANHLEMPYCVDAHVVPVVRLKSTMAREEVAARLPNAIFDIWVNLRLPDFSSLNWDALMEVRESDAGTSFRKMIHRLSDRVKAALPNVADQREIDVIIGAELNRELLAELSQRTTSVSSTAVSFALNFIPFGNIPSMMKDAAALEKDQSSWVSFVQNYPSRGS